MGLKEDVPMIQAHTKMKDCVHKWMKWLLCAVIKCSQQMQQQQQQQQNP